MSAGMEGSTAVTSTTTPTVTEDTTLPLACGGGSNILTASNGYIKTLGWPHTPYPIDAECEWKIQCPVSSKVKLNFKGTFRVAGQMPNCSKDQLFIYDCDDTISHGPFCHLTPPDPMFSTCNVVKVSFSTTPMRGITRTGFKLNYQCTASLPPTATSLPVTTHSPQCGGGPQIFTAPVGSIQTLGYGESPYPTNTDCLWKVECPASTKVQVIFNKSFRVAGRMPECPKDQLMIYSCNGLIIYGPFCHLTAPAPFTTTCNVMDVSFKAGNQRGKTRTGFKLTYACVY